MINILLSGCNGKMGQVISKMASESSKLRISAGYDINNTLNNSYPVFTNLKDCKEKIDVIIDFSNPNALDELLKYALAKKIPTVIATTGLSQIHKTKIETASKSIPIFTSANMSLGINILTDLVKKVAKILEGSFDIEIVEKHHNQKIDAPSGTALALADAINDVLDQKLEYTYDRHSRRKKRGENEIGMHAVRGGTIVGEHTVIFAGKDEIIEISHSAMSKDIFATGALRAALFLHDKKPGLYSMESIISDF